MADDRAVNRMGIAVALGVLGVILALAVSRWLWVSASDDVARGYVMVVTGTTIPKNYVFCCGPYITILPTQREPR